MIEWIRLISLVAILLMSTPGQADWQIIQQQTVNASDGQAGGVTNIKIMLSEDKMRQEQTPAGDRSRSVLHIIKKGSAIVCGAFRKSSGTCTKSKLDAFDMLSGMRGVQVEFKFREFSFKGKKKAKKVAGIDCTPFKVTSVLDLVIMKSMKSEINTNTRGCFAKGISTKKIFAPSFESAKVFSSKFASKKAAAQFKKMKLMGFPLEQNNQVTMAAIAGAPAMNQKMQLKTLSVKKVPTFKAKMFKIPNGFTLSEK